MRGETLPPPRIDTLPMIVPVMRASGLHNLSMPRVVAGTFRDAPSASKIDKSEGKSDGSGGNGSFLPSIRIGTVVASAYSETVTNATLHLAEWWKATAPIQTIVYNGTSGAMLQKYSGLPATLELELEPLGTRMVIVEEAQY